MDMEKLKAWKAQNLINMALDLGATNKEIRHAFEGDAEEKSYMEAQLQIVIKARKVKK